MRTYKEILRMAWGPGRSGYWTATAPHYIIASVSVSARSDAVQIAGAADSLAQFTDWRTAHPPTPSSWLADMARAPDAVVGFY